MSVALVLPLPADIAEQLALDVDGALPPGELHLTLAMIDGDADSLAPAVAALAASLGPVDVTLSGVGRFACPGGEDAFHATVDGPTLPALRAAVEGIAGDRLDRTHGFDPHVTLAYLAPDAPSPLARLDPVAVTFAELALWEGDSHRAFPLDGDPMTTPAARQMIRRELLIAERLAGPAGAVDGAAEADPYTFDVVASDESIDSHGTIVRGFRLDRFAANPVILFAHDHTRIVGGASNVSHDGPLRMTITLAEEGTSATVDEVRSLRRQKLLRGISVSVLPGTFSIEKAADGSEVLVLGDNELIEVSVCAVPSNANALAEMRAAAAATRAPGRTTPRPTTMTTTTMTTKTKPATRAEGDPKPDPTLPETDPKPKLPVEKAAMDMTAMHEVYAAELGAAVDSIEGLDDTQLSAVRDAIAAGLESARVKCEALCADPTMAEASADEMRAQLAAEVTRADNAERALLVSQGKDKLTPALEKLYAKRPPADLRAFLAAAPVVPALARTQHRTQPAGGALPAPVPGVPDKPFEQLSAQEKHLLLTTNKLAFEQRLAVYESRVGVQPRYRALLAG